MSATKPLLTNDFDGVLVWHANRTLHLHIGRQCFHHAQNPVVISLATNDHRHKGAFGKSQKPSFGQQRASIDGIRALLGYKSVLFLLAPMVGFGEQYSQILLVTRIMQSHERKTVQIFTPQGSTHDIVS